MLLARESKNNITTLALFESNNLAQNFILMLMMTLYDADILTLAF